jgi:hypothetical protein
MSLPRIMHMALGANGLEGVYKTVWNPLASKFPTRKQMNEYQENPSEEIHMMTIVLVLQGKYWVVSTQYFPCKTSPVEVERWIFHLLNPHPHGWMGVYITMHVYTPIHACLCVSVCDRERCVGGISRLLQYKVWALSLSLTLSLSLHAGPVLPDRALCFPTFSHFLIVNKTSLSISLSRARARARSLLLSLSHTAAAASSCSGLARLHEMRKLLLPECANCCFRIIALSQAPGGGGGGEGGGKAVLRT